MTEKTETQAGGAPVPGAAPAPAPAAPDLAQRIRAAQAELARLRVQAAAPGTQLVATDPAGTVTQFTHGGVTVTADPSPVPAHSLSALLEAAVSAGVRLILTEA